MKKLHFTSQFKKDFKKYRNQPKKIEKLFEVLHLLEEGEELPEVLRAHKLIGDYKDCLECHIESDLLLIWIDAENDIIKLVRLGSHSELFG